MVELGTLSPGTPNVPGGGKLPAHGAVPSSNSTPGGTKLPSDQAVYKVMIPQKTISSNLSHTSGTKSKSFAAPFMQQIWLLRALSRGGATAGAPFSN